MTSTGAPGVRCVVVRVDPWEEHHQWSNLVWSWPAGWGGALNSDGEADVGWSQGVEDTPYGTEPPVTAEPQFGLC
jgi:hypothetical protein